MRAALPVRDAIAAARAGLVALSTGRAEVPQRVVVRVPGGTGLVLYMPGAVGGGLGVKAVAVFPGNPARGLPLIHAAVLIQDAATGRLLALLEGGSLTALRTGAAGGLACDLLARPDAGRVAVFGTGVQARAQLEAAAAVRRLAEVRVVGRRREAAEAFVRAAREWPDLAGARVEVAGDPDAAVRAADVVITATTSAAPLFDGRAVPEGAHVTAVGAFTPEAREVDSALIARARIVVDTRAGALAEAGDLRIPIAEGALDPGRVAELGEVAAGLRPGRTSPRDVTVYKSVGTAVLDVSVGLAVLRRAGQENSGIRVDLDG